MADDDQTTPATPSEPSEPTDAGSPPPSAAPPSAPPPEDVMAASTAQPVAAAAPPPPPGAPAVAPRRKRRWLPVFLVIMGVIVVLWIAGGVLFATRTLPPYEAASDFIDDLADNRFQSAADRLCGADQEDPDAAIQTVTRHFAGRDNVVTNPFTVDRDGDTARVDYTVSNDDDSGDDDETHVLTLVNEDGDWKPCPSAA